MKKQQLTSFYLESLVLIAAFVAMILVLTGVFGASRSQSVKARDLSQAVTIAANAAEAVSASGTLEEAAALLDQGGNVQIRDGAIEAFYRADGAPCPDGDGALRLLLTWEVSGLDPSLVESTLTVFTEKDGKELYSLETARYRKEAAA